MNARHAVAAVAILVVAASIGMSGTLALAPGDGSAEMQADTTAQAATCDYVGLYNRTIDSVVAVRTNGGLGSGFVYEVAGEDDAGYVVTNAHVVGAASSVVVQFTGGESRSGTVLGRDRFTDLAVVRVNETPASAEALPVADAQPSHGRKVAAIGNPFGLEETITHGIVSGTDRSMPTELGFTIPNVVQTDAPINPGNSGGPLVTCDGTVVGVNTAGISAARAENVGFAISASLVNQIVPELIETGDYEHAFLGVSTAPITPQLRTANDLPVTSGVYVHDVVDDGPASGVLQGTTGYRIVDGTRVPVGGDTIVAIGGQQITSGEDLSTYLLTETRPGQTVMLTVIRDGERQQVEVTLGERPDPSAP